MWTKRAGVSNLCRKLSNAKGRQSFAGMSEFPVYMVDRLQSTYPSNCVRRVWIVVDQSIIVFVFGRIVACYDWRSATHTHTFVICNMHTTTCPTMIHDGVHFANASQERTSTSNRERDETICICDGGLCSLCVYNDASHGMTNVCWFMRRQVGRCDLGSMTVAETSSTTSSLPS